MFTTFIKATNEYNTLEKSVPAPYFRQTFSVTEKIASAHLFITGLGFYEAHINGTDITKGILAPYVSHPDHYVYYDRYDITEKITSGRNVLAVILGNGFINSAGGYIWDFDKTDLRSAPILSFKIEICYVGGKTEIIEPSMTTKTASSPIIFDDMRHGEYYDARLEIEGWDSAVFDDSGWNDPIIADPPRGEQKLRESDPITEIMRISPKSITAFENGYVYDFGVNSAGLTLLDIKNCKKGQKVVLKYFETLKDGKPFFDNIRFAQDDRTKLYQQNVYICKGEPTETHLPRFTYDGFRYVYVSGIDKSQATEKLLTYIVYSSSDRSGSVFSCDNETINKIQDATVRADIANLYHFPTDCPQREKNGWTADAALSAEQMLINIKPVNCFKEWLRNIYKAMSDEGKLPGIVPTYGWGYNWANGPAWDKVIVYLPYYTYIYKGDSEIIREAAGPINKYLHYLDSVLNDKNLLEIGLGDWCEPDKDEWEFTTPLVVTDTIVSIDIAQKARFIFDTLSLDEYSRYAYEFEQKLVKAVKENLIDNENLTVYGGTQTGLALALYFGLFEEKDHKAAFENLLEKIKEKDNHCYCGVVGGSVFYDLLAENGYVDLALEIILKNDFPSYADWINRGATTLWEAFRREGDTINSLDHHFWGFISAWFYKYIAGIRVNPGKHDINEIEIRPLF
ncbi:MAG: family 78 glycoside hydrolase catalytic domain, partial [Clostridia bacterium]|nr:family 78 glycoside hydrolase catalytic domain [Clostridia bacterium]